MEGPLLSLPSHLILVKHDLFAIFNYLLSVFRAPMYFLQKIKSVATKFLWYGEKESGLVWHKWEICCLHKAKGGLGLRDLGCLNQALLAKVARWLLREAESLLSKVLMGKYCQRQHFLEAKSVPSSSWGWKGIVWGKGLKWRGSNGKSKIIRVCWDE